MLSIQCLYQSVIVSGNTLVSNVLGVARSFQSAQSVVELSCLGSSGVRPQVVFRDNIVVSNTVFGSGTSPIVSTRSVPVDFRNNTLINARAYGGAEVKITFGSCLQSDCGIATGNFFGASELGDTIRQPVAYGTLEVRSSTLEVYTCNDACLWGAVCIRASSCFCPFETCNAPTTSTTRATTLPPPTVVADTTTTIAITTTTTVPSSPSSIPAASTRTAATVEASSSQDSVPYCLTL
jgi:hypothetical protein